MTIEWLMTRAPSVPEGDAWLGPDERQAQTRLKIEKRRSEWRLGRFAAKQLVSRVTNVDELDRIQVIAAEDGAPEAFVDGEAVPVSLSITHRDGVAACVCTKGARVGCDLEAVEPRTQRFINDFFTDRERDAVARTRATVHDRHVALVWSAKESALKVLRVGLRRDTRSVEVEIDDPAVEGPDWQPLAVVVRPENLTCSGWWRAGGDFVLTLVSDDPHLRVAGHDEER